MTLSAAEVVYSEQTSDAGLALVIVRPDASITVAAGIREVLCRNNPNSLWGGGMMIF